MFKTEETTKPLLKKLYYFKVNGQIKNEDGTDIATITSYEGAEFGIGPEEAIKEMAEKIHSNILKKYPEGKKLDIEIIDAKLLAE